MTVGKTRSFTCTSGASHRGCGVKSCWAKTLSVNPANVPMFPRPPAESLMPVRSVVLYQYTVVSSLIFVRLFLFCAHTALRLWVGMYLGNGHSCRRRWYIVLPSRLYILFQFCDGVVVTILWCDNDYENGNDEQGHLTAVCKDSFSQQCAHLALLSREH